MVSKQSELDIPKMIVKNFTIKESTFSKVVQKVNRLNKKLAVANRLPIELLNVKKADNFEKYEGKYVVSEEISFTLSYERPFENGWILLASLDFVKNENIFNLYHTNNIPQDLNIYKTSNSCDHCNHNRKRLKTYLIKNIATGEVKQIGKSCFSQFVGVDSVIFDLVASLNIDDVIASAEKLRYSTARPLPTAIHVETFVAYSITSIKNFGYLSHKMGSSTGVRVWNSLINGMDKKQFDSIETNRPLAKKIIEWALSLEHSSNSYYHNLSVLAKTEIVRSIHANLASSMVKSYNDLIAKELAEKELLDAYETGGKVWKLKRKEDDYNHQDFLGMSGTGKSIDIFVRYESHYEFNSVYGYTFCYTFRNTYGELIKWFTPKKFEFSFGDEMTLNAKVKCYKDEKSRIAYINYVKVLT